MKKSQVNGERQTNALSCSLACLRHLFTGRKHPRKYLKILFSKKKSLKAETSASDSRVAVCICNSVSAIFLLIFTAISKYSQCFPHLAATNLIVSELCIKGERLLHFLNKHTPPPNSTYKCLNYCTLGTTASHLDKDQAITKKVGITIPEPHVPGPCFG